MSGRSSRPVRKRSARPSVAERQLALLRAKPALPTCDHAYRAMTRRFADDEVAPVFGVPEDRADG